MRLYLKFFSMHLKSCMAYKKSFFFKLIGQFLTSFTGFLSIWFLFDRFNVVKGYTISECLLCAGVISITFAIAEMFFRGFDSMSSVISNMEFDRMLLRPRGLVFQMMCYTIEFGRIGRILQGAMMLAYGVAASNIVWTADKIAVLIFMIIGGTLLFGMIFILHAAMCFFTIEGIEWMNVFTYGAREYGSYPLDVYGKTVLRFCTFVIPYAFIQYYPMTYLLGRTQNVFCGLLPLAAAWFAIPCLALWNYGVRKYKSTGS